MTLWNGSSYDSNNNSNASKQYQYSFVVLCWQSRKRMANFVELSGFALARSHVFWHFLVVLLLLLLLLLLVYCNAFNAKLAHIYHYSIKLMDDVARRHSTVELVWEWLCRSECVCVCVLFAVYAKVANEAKVDLLMRLQRAKQILNTTVKENNEIKFRQSKFSSVKIYELIQIIIWNWNELNNCNKLFKVEIFSKKWQCKEFFSDHEKKHTGTV